MRLLDSKIREINRFLEAGKPLPDAYRFLLFENKRETELVWNGKTDQICNTVLPFQTIEHVDEPRSEEDRNIQGHFFDPETGRQLQGWTNKLIWGDNKLILSSSLKNGPLREEIEAQGGIKLIYIDPPFDVGADFSMNIPIGEDTFTKKPNILEEIAYRDTWGKGADSFIAMIYERLCLMKDLLADDGSIYVHCDYRLSGYLRLVMDQVFGKNNFRNEIIWSYRTGGTSKNFFAKKHDIIFYYSKGEKTIFNPQTQKSYLDTKFFKPHQKKSKELNIKSDYIGMYRMVDCRDVWDDINALHPRDDERIDYPTQKPVELIQRIIDASTNTNDIVADFFCGSGTTMAVAQGLRVRRAKKNNGKAKLKYYFTSQRKWIGCDLSKFAIHTTRKRMIEVQRELKKAGKDYRAFEVLNLGKYERQHYIETNNSSVEQKGKEFIDLILSAYSADAVTQNSFFHGKKSGRFVIIGPINLPVNRLFIQEVINESLNQKIFRVDILSFEFEMGLFPNILDEAKRKGIDLTIKYIPQDVFDKRVVEKKQVVFHDISYIEVSVETNKDQLRVELKDFSVYYSQDSIEPSITYLKNGQKKVILENGKIIKLSKDKGGELKRNILTEKWTDWIDYWSVDFDFESKKEIIRTKNHENEEFQREWTGDYIFENEWQSFRTKNKKDLELKTPWHQAKSSKVKIAVKVIDILGNDTMKIVEVRI